MIAQLCPDSCNKVVHGPGGRSGGVTACSFAVRPGSYDHNRSAKVAIETGAPARKKLPIWDFVVFRGDGSAIRLHPEWQKTRFPTFQAEGHVEEVLPPLSGKGRSMGHGTHKHYKTVINAETMWFRPGGH